MKIRWSQAALDDLDYIFAYIYERNRSAAKAVADRIEALAIALRESPRLGHPADEEGVRVLPVVRYPYVIFYTINEVSSEVVVLHIRHTARAPLG